MADNKSLDMLEQSLFIAEENEQSNASILRHVCEILKSVSSLALEVAELNESLQDCSSTLRYLNAE